MVGLPVGRCVSYLSFYALCRLPPHKEEPRKDIGYTHPTGTLRGFFFRSSRTHKDAIVGIWPLKEDSIHLWVNGTCPPTRTTRDRL
jgi:hypothetical protein